MANTLRFKRGLATGIPTALAGEPLFTTDTFDLYIGNGTTNTRFQKYIASGTTSQLLKGDGSLLTMPIVLTSPLTGQVLKFNGTNWVNDSDAGITGSGTANRISKFTGTTTLGNSSLIDNISSIAFTFSNNPVYSISDGTNTSFIGTATTAGAYNNNTSIGDLILRGFNGVDIEGGQGAGGGIRVTNVGRVLIGSTSDNGQRLQVTGTALITGATSIVGNLTNTNSNFQTFGSTDYAASTWGMSIGNAGLSSNFIKANNQYFQNSTGVTGFEMTSNGTLCTFSAFGTASYGASTWGIIIGNGLGSSNFYKANSHNFQNGSGTASLTINSAGAATFASSVTATAFIPTAATIISNGMYLGAANTLTFATNATERMRLDASGNLGIGTTSPSYKLDVQGTSGTVAIRAASNTSGDILYYATGTVTGSLNAFTTAINATGNVIGTLQNNNTASGSAFLDISVPSASTGDPYLVFTTSGATNWSIGTDNSDSDKLKFGNVSNPSNGATTLVLHTTGNTSLGAVTDTGEKLQVNGTMKVTGASTFNGTGASISMTTAGDTALWSQVTNAGGILYVGRDNAAGGSFGVANAHVIYGTAARPMVFFTNATERFRISDTGAATFSSSVTATSGIITGNLTVDTNSLFVDSINDRVGIGTATPDARLRVSGGANSTQAIFGNIDGRGLAISTSLIGGTNEAGVIFNARSSVTSGTFIFQTDGTQRMQLDASGLGIGIAATSSLHVSGSVAKSHTTKTANYTATESDYTILCNTTGGGFTITLPAASGCIGRIYVIKKTIGNSGVNNVTIDGNASETIDGSATFALQCRSSVMIQSDGSNWWILSQYADNSCI